MTPSSSSSDRLAYRPAELAAMVGLSPKAIYRAIERGELAAAKVANGSRLLIPAESAECWLQTSAAGPTERVTARHSSRPSFRRPLADALARVESEEG